MDRDRELWACALHVERMHGLEAPNFIAERIYALAVADDIAGVETWKAIGARLGQLRLRSGGEAPD